VWRIGTDNHGQSTTPGDPGVAALALRQHGVVSNAQLRALGLGRGAIEHRVRRGRLHLLYRGVYAVGHAKVDGRGRLWAAALATNGVVSHRSAAWVWELAPPPASRIEVTTLAASRSLNSITVHRSRLAPEDIAHHEGLPVTTLARTLVDLADVLTPHRLERICHRAEHLRLLDVKAIDTVLARAPGRRSKALRAALNTLTHAGPQLTRSELEDLMLALAAKFALPRPLVNRQVHGKEVDFLWPEQRLVLEADGAATHATRTAFEEDRARDLHLKTHGYDVIRVTHRMLTTRPHDVARLLRARLTPTGQENRSIARHPARP
jgi:very-short-patch-repair endonuclease